jgi:predicted DNA-binding protein YlxM (UPF0122 family)
MTTYKEFIEQYSEFLSVKKISTTVGIPRQTLEDAIRRDRVTEEMEARLEVFFKKFTLDLVDIRKHRLTK